MIYDSNKKKPTVSACLLFVFVIIVSFFMLFTTSQAKKDIFSKPTPQTLSILSKTRPVTAKQNNQEHFNRAIIGWSEEGRPIEALIFGHGSNVSFFLSSIHGDEKAGAFLIWLLSKYLITHPSVLDGRKAILVPLANPDGWKRNSRYNSKGVDLNRNFNSSNRRNNETNGLHALSEQESRAIENVITTYQPTLIVSIHGTMGCIDYDGPGLDLAYHMKQFCAIPIRKLGARPGSLGSYAGLKLKIPTITLELPRLDDKINLEYLWKFYGNALIAALVYPLWPEVPYENLATFKKHYDTISTETWN